MARSDGTNSGCVRAFLAVTAAVVLLTVVTFRIEDGPHLHWTGPVVPRAILAALPRARAMMSPHVEYFMVEQNGAVTFVPDLYPDFERLAVQGEAGGFSVPLVTVVARQDRVGAWSSSFRTDGWWIREPQGITLTEAQRQSVLGMSRIAVGPQSRRTVTPWLLVDALGLLLVAAWVRLGVRGVRHGWRFRVGTVGCCPACGYDLTGLPAPVCPECGGRGG